MVRVRLVVALWLALSFGLVVAVSCKSTPTGTQASTISCATNSDCPANQQCHPMAKVCVGCLPHQGTCLQDGFVCDEVTFTCRPPMANEPCRFNSECPSATSSKKAVVCQTSTGNCVECLTGADCDPHDAPICDNGYTGTDAAPTPSMNSDGSISFTCQSGCFLCYGQHPICDTVGGRCCAPDGGICVIPNHN